MSSEDFLATKDIDEVAIIHSNPKYANWRCEYIDGEYRFYSTNYKKQDTIKFENNVVEINDEIISHNVVDIPQENEIYLVHSTDFFPTNKTILSNADGRKRIPFQYEVDDDIFVVKEFVSPRQTVHFTINGKVENTSKGEGIWDNPKFIVIEPYSIHKDEIISGKIHSGDNFTNNSVKLSDNTILMVREDVYNSLNDEQKEMYNIVKYSGNANICVENLLTSKGIPVVKNYAEDKTHFMSEQFAQEEVLEKRAKAIKLIKNMDLSYSNDNYYFTNEDIAMLYYNGIISSQVNEDVVKKINEELNLDSENLVNFIVSNGIVKVGTNSYSLLSIEELKKHFNDPDFYIESIKKSGTGLTELKSIIGNTNVDAYQNTSLLEKNHNFNDITVGQLQTLQNFNTIKHLKQQLHISKNKVLILREDGLYLSDRIEKDAYAGIMIQNYEFKNNSEVLLGSNIDTLGSIINKYNQALESIIFDDFNTSKIDYENMDTTSMGGRSR